MKKHPLKKVSVFYIPLLATVVSISVLTAPLQAQTVTVPSADSAARDTSRAMQQSKPADSTASTAPQTTASNGAQVDSAAEAPSQMAERSVHFSLSQFDYLLDCAIGMILPRLTEVRPGNYTTLGKGTFLFDLGLLCQFNERWYSRIGVKKSQIRYRASTMVQSVESLVYSHIDGDETLSFITLSIASGRRFPCGAVTPYLFASLEPAYLTAAHQTTITRTFVQFPDSAHMTVQSYQDKNSLPSRHRYTVFAAGGVGCEINYGYGSVFAEASLQMALRTIPIDQKTATSQQLPVTITYRLFTLPLGIGLRFYI